ncbi:MAG: ATP-dependent 6-phosphofructokinase [Planctomycetes bacterium]|nr:ATP-dependent 6-phosphofructokinase [Planctomycetota bacterium]
MKIGVLTGGSDVPGLNAVLRAVVRTAVFRYADDVVGVRQGWEGLLQPPEIWTLSPQSVRGFSRRGGTLLGSCNRGSPFQQGGVDRSAEVLETLRWLGMDGLICIGGDGSLAIADRLARRGLPVVGIPQAVANDMAATRVTFGHATAVATATEAIDKLQTTRQSHHRVMYLQVSGTQAGWIAVHAGLAGGADVVLIPEIPFRPEHVAEVIRARTEQGKSATIVVVADGVAEVGQRPFLEDEAVGAGNVAQRVAERVAEHAPEEFRVTPIGHLLRGGDPVPQDRILATRFGAAAVRAVHDGAFGTLVTLRDDRVELVPLEQAVGNPRLVELDCEAVWTARSLGVSFGDAPPTIVRG